MKTLLQTYALSNRAHKAYYLIYPSNITKEAHFMVIIPYHKKSKVVTSMYLGLQITKKLNRNQLKLIGLCLGTIFMTHGIEA